MADFVPTVTRDANGFLMLDWPMDRCDETMVARELLVQMVDDLNRLRTQLWQARTGNALLQLEKERAICDRLYKLLYSGVWSTTDPEVNMELAKAVSDYEELRHNPQPQREVIKDDC